MATTGEVTLDFGTNPVTDGSVVVTGQAGILTTSYVEAWIMGAITTDHNEDEHIYENIEIRCGIPTAATGFTIYGISTVGETTGQFKIKWVWS